MSALVILRTNAMHIYSGDGIPTGGALPPTAIADMEVVSESELDAFITSIAGSRNPRSPTPAIVILSDELCYSVAFVSGKEEEALKHVLALAPFTRIATTLLRAADRNVAIAVNQDLYETVARSLQKAGFSVVAVVSWAGVVQHGISSRGEIDKLTVKRAFDALQTLKAGAFPLGVSQPEEPKDAVQPVQAHQRKLPFGWIIFGALVLVYIVIMYWFFLR